MELRDYQQKAVSDVAQAWRDGFFRPCVVMPCGAGKSLIVAEIAKRTTDNGNRILFLVHRRELCEQIHNTFQGYGVDMSRCDIEMVQTATRHLNKIQPPTLIITDENHHAPAKSYRRIYEAFPNTCCVGVTATPTRLNGGGLGDVNDKLIIGPSVRELIDRQCLAPFDYYAPPVADLSGLHTRGGEFIAEEVENALSHARIYGDVIRYYRELADHRKAICYCVSVAYSQRMAQQFRDAGIPAEHIDGNTPPDQRADVIARFRSGETKILCNVDLISEGFDVPDCGASILLRPTKSLTLFTQQAMRCMRYEPGKRAVIIDHVGNVHRHGLPDTTHEWTLDTEPASENKNTSTVQVKQCTQCFYTHTPGPVCPKCGYVYPPAKKDPKEERAAELQKIVADYKAPEQCSDISELYAFAKKKGYRPGWAYVQACKRGWLRGKGVRA